MQWAYPERWPALVLVPAACALLAWAFADRRRALARFVAPPLIRELAGAVDDAARRAKAALVVAGLALLAVALIGPQWGIRWQRVTRRGVDLMIALDVSKSMLAQDVKPNRLERAKLAVRDLIPLLHGDRIGLIAFAGTSFAQCPLTSDYGAFALMLEEVTPEIIPRGGTALAQAIRTGITAFQAGSTGSQALIIISDGENHEGDALEAAKEAAKAGIKIYTIGIGTPEGELIPIVDESGHQTFLKDRDGRTVKSRLDERILEQIALATGGSYVRATPTSFGLDVLYRERIAALSQRDFESAMRKRAEHRFQWPLAFALLALAVELVIPERRTAEAG